MAYSRLKALKMQLDNGEWLQLPYCLYNVGLKDESRQYMMMSGRKVETVLGYRKTITAQFDYIPQETVAAFNEQTKRGGFQLVEYIDTDGATKQGLFKVQPFQPTVLIFKDNAPMWHEMALEMEAQDLD